MLADISLPLFLNGNSPLGIRDDHDYLVSNYLSLQKRFAEAVFVKGLSAQSHRHIR